MTSTIVVNAILIAIVVGILLWLLTHMGIAKSRRHEIRMLRMHGRRR